MPSERSSWLLRADADAGDDDATVLVSKLQVRARTAKGSGLYSGRATRGRKKSLLSAFTSSHVRHNGDAQKDAAFAVFDKEEK